MSAIEKLPDADLGVLRFLTCGSVDDGKSTLIGRLLYDTKAILADTLAQIEKTSERKGLSAVDLSLLTDGLTAEREQGITIDVAYRYCTTGKRDFIIADAPGHEQYTRNMVTAASTANLAIILIDARHGVVTQTRRHSTIAHLLGIPHLVVAVNKMDLVDYDEAVFDRIKADYLAFGQRIGLEDGICDVRFIPISALEGDMIVERGTHMDWYPGDTLLDILENTPGAHSERPEASRFPVQYVCRPQAAEDPALHDYRGYQGRVESGTLRVGDEIVVLPSGQTSRISDIQILGQSLAEAVAEQSVTILLEDDIDVSRGDLITRRVHAPDAVKEIRATVCWLSQVPLDRARTYLIRHTTRESKAKVIDIGPRLDINTLEKVPAERLDMNDLASVRFKLAQPLFVDCYRSNRATGAFIIIDESTNNTVGAGMID